MQRKFITNLALLLFLNLLIKPFWMLGIDATVQNRVGAEVYGIYYALFNFSFLLNIILDFGITNFNNKNIAQNNHLLNKHLSSIIVLRLLLALVYTLVTLLAGWIIGYSFFQMKMLAILVFNMVLLSFILYLRSNLSGLHLFRTDSFISVLDRLIMISICGILLWGNVTDKPFDIDWFIYSQTAAYLLTALFTLVIVIDKARMRRLTWNYTFFILILKKSYPYAVLVLLMTFYNRIDAVMLERLLENGAEQSGVYASAYRLLDSANMIAFLFASLLLPIFSKMLKQKESVEQLVKLAFSLIITLALLSAVGSFFYRRELMALLYHEHIDASASVFGILMMCFVAISTTYIFGTLLTANGNMLELNMMAASGMVINIVLNLILIPRYQAIGSAVSSLITQFLMALAQVLLVKKRFRFRVNYRFLTSLALFLAGIILISYFSKSWTLPWGISFGIMAVFAVLWAFIVKIIDLRGLYRVLLHG